MNTYKTKKTEDLFEDGDLYKVIPAARRKRYRQILSQQSSTQDSTGGSQGSTGSQESTGSSQESCGEISSSSQGSQSDDSKTKTLTLWHEIHVPNVDPNPDLVRDYKIYVKVKGCNLISGTEIAGVAEHVKTSKKYKFIYDGVRDKLVIIGVVLDKIEWKHKRRAVKKSLLHPDSKRIKTKGARIEPEPEILGDPEPESPDRKQNQMTKGKTKKKSLFV